MKPKCTFCNDTKIEPGQASCVWCECADILPIGERAVEVVQDPAKLAEMISALMTANNQLMLVNQALQSRLNITDAENDRLRGVFGAYGETLEPFVALMAKELAANSHKGDREGWLGMTPRQALSEVEYHFYKLDRAIDDDSTKEHAADVANCAMMLLDAMGLLIPAQDGNHEHA